MAAPWIFAFSDETRAVFTVLKRAAREGIGADTVFGFLREAGHEVVRSEVREVIGRLNIEEQTRRYFKELAPSTRPLREFIPESATSMIKNYRYSIRLIGRHTETNEFVDRVVSLTSNIIISKARAEQMILDSLVEFKCGTLMVVDSAQVELIERRA